MTDETLERWDVVWSDVQAFDAKALEAAVSDVFAALEREHGSLIVSEKPRTDGKGQKLPAVVRWGGKQSERSEIARAPLTAKLVSMFPHWYGRGRWYVGNETFGGCFCHGLPIALVSGPGSGAKWVVSEVSAMLSALQQWAPHIDRVEHCENHAERAVLAHDATIAMIDVMIDSNWISESWYGFVDDGVRWMLQAATGLSPNEPPIRNVASASFAFSSWTSPSSSQKNNFADSIAALLER